MLIVKFTDSLENGCHWKQLFIKVTKRITVGIMKKCVKPKETNFTTCLKEFRDSCLNSSFNGTSNSGLICNDMCTYTNIENIYAKHIACKIKAECFQVDYKE